jgi:hypothetical protein
MADDPTRSDDELEKLELEKLKLQKQRLELKAQIDALTAPWWRKASLIATMTAIIAAVLPVTTAIQKHYENERELALQQQRQETELALLQARQENDIRLTYLQRFEMPGHRMQTLRFLIATSTDPRLIAWAREEKAIVQAELDSIEEQIRTVVEELERNPQGPRADELKARLVELTRLLQIKGVAPMTAPGPAGAPAPAPAPNPATAPAGSSTSPALR